MAKNRKLTREEMDAIDEELIANGASPWIIIDVTGIEFEWYIDRLIPVIPYIKGRATLLEVDSDNLPAG